MKKKVIILYIVFFIIGLYLVHGIYYICKGSLDTTNYENRQLAQMPNILETGVEQFPIAFESYYNDHIPFRNQLIGLNNRINYYLFKSNQGNQVLIGKDGWLFIKDPMQGNPLTNYTGEDLLDDEQLEALTENLLNNQKYIESLGKEFVVMISPNKSRIYSEYMPDYLTKAEEYQLKQIIDYVRSNTDIRIIYDGEQLLDAKHELEDRNIIVFHKVDTHWNNVGAYVGASSLLGELGIEMPMITDSCMNIEPIPNEDCDLANMLHMKNDFINTEVNYKVTGYATNGVEQLQDNFNEVIEYRSVSPDKRTVYIARDSFATAMGSYVGSQVEHLYMRHKDTYTNDDFLSVDPDVFVLETVERGAAYDLTNFTAW